MTSIHIHQTEAVPSEKKSRVEVLPREARAEKPKDRDLMYAWSIGVTSAAKSLVEQSPAERENCPPEVYIG